MLSSNYDKHPFVSVPSAFGADLWLGWQGIAGKIAETLDVRRRRGLPRIVAVECYSGVFVEELALGLMEGCRDSALFFSLDAFKAPLDIDRLLEPFLGGNDPVFGFLCSTLEMDDLLDPQRSASLRTRIIEASEEGIVFIVGPGASLLCQNSALLVYADMPRWEGQLRQRRNEVSNLGVENRTLKATLKYKRSFFADWRICDRLKQRSLDRWDFVLDTVVRNSPKMTTGAAHLAALAQAVTRPFRVVPFFDPGVWGGQWMKRVCDLEDTAPNYAWCFDCVPEENSLLLGFPNGVRFEIASLNLVFRHPRELLGDAVYRRFGPEFPIRFDFLDTMGGGNLSLQVHPLASYAKAHFGLSYTQDESYYIMDAEPGAEVFLGGKNGARVEDFFEALEDALSGKAALDASRYAGRFPAKKHDHFLIPAGTLHCSGAGSMVLEISATPYIFTFKLWDWNRLGLDGLPRPVHLKHGRNVLQWDRDEDFARKQLIDRVAAVASGSGWREESTGLHESEFIETRRHWFSGSVPHDTGGRELGGVQVLNLVEGRSAVVESPTGAFEPFIVHYAETFIVPAAVGAYSIRPLVSGAEHATMKAFVR